MISRCKKRLQPSQLLASPLSGMIARPSEGANKRAELTLASRGK
jgi:hypothetical protein